MSAHDESIDPITDPQRLTELERTELLDTEPEEAFDRYPRLVRRTVGVPVAFISLVDSSRQFFKSQLGMPEPWAGRRQTPLSHSFCKQVVNDDAPLIVDDARGDERVCDNPAIEELGVVAYAGFPLRAASGHVLGTLCAVGGEPRAWSDHDLAIMRDLADAAASEIELRIDRRERRALEQWRAVMITAMADLPVGVMITSPEIRNPPPTIEWVNDALTRMTGFDREELIGATPRLFQGPNTSRETLDRLVAALERGEGYEDETVNYRKDGQPYDVIWSIRPVVDESGRPHHFVSVQQDVTARNRQREELEQAVEARTAELSQSYADVLDRLATAGEYRDDQTGRHTERVGAVAALIAEELGRSENEREILRKGARLHDVGKIGIPDGVLLKPGKLTEAEFEGIKSHTTIGERILSGSRSRLVQTAALIARSHHERWDGRGYPDGLAGDAVPLFGRITAVADVLDALTHERPYKEAWPLAAAFAEIERQGGAQFDPQVVDALGRRRAEAEAILRRE